MNIKYGSKGMCLEMGVHIHGESTLIRITAKNHGKCGTSQIADLEDLVRYRTNCLYAIITVLSVIKIVLVYT